MRYQKPPKLKAGDKVAIVSPSWGGPNAFPHIYENGLKILHRWGLKIREYPTTRAQDSFLRANPEARARDINNAFADPAIRAIFVSVGGNDSIRILPFHNKKITRANPKILMGYSDTLTLHTFANLLGLVTFSGPSIMAGLSQIESLSPTFKEHVR